jgi:Flp pilus assembly protein TadB
MNDSFKRMNEERARMDAQRVSTQRAMEGTARTAKIAADTAARARKQFEETAARAHGQFQKNVNNTLRAKQHTGENVRSGGGKLVLGFLVICAILFALFVLIVSGLK